MAEGDGGNLIFDWELLETARGVLAGKPEQGAVNAADGMSAEVATFGTAPGGAEAAGRLNDWIIQASRDLMTVTTEVESLSLSTGQAAQLARDLDTSTQAIAQGSGGVSPAQVAQGNDAIAKPLEAPAPHLGEG